jgi:hypothetical protein
MVKGIKLKEKSKRKKKGFRILAIIGRIRTRDPDPGYFGPDFDSWSGLGSAFTDLVPGARLKARDFLDFLRTFFGLSGLDLYLKRYARMCVWRGGGTASIKIWVKTRKIVGSASLLLDCTQVFYTSRGGDRRPQFAIWRVGVFR